MDSVVAYLRVSIERQQRSGLGIEAQRAAITLFVDVEGLTIVGEFVEAETGKGADALDRRPHNADGVPQWRLKTSKPAPGPISRLPTKP